MKKEQIKGFNEAHRKAKKLGFENYCCIPNATWKQAKDNFDKGLILKEEDYILLLEENVQVVLNTKGKKLPYCKTCECLFSAQEFRAGYKNCEYCEAKKKRNKDELQEVVKEKLNIIKNKNRGT